MLAIAEQADKSDKIGLMTRRQRLNYVAIKMSLVETQQNFDVINANLTVERTPLSDELINNLLAGYAQIDEYLAKGIDLFKVGNSDLLLALNKTVLYHSTDISTAESSRQFEATQQHFYEAKNGGIGHLMEWLDMHRGSSVWKRSAGLFTYIMSQPQLFIEGNHRTGAIIMSYMLMREGYAPFVLSLSNAQHFFEPAELIKKRRKKTMDELLYLPKQTRKFAKLLKHEQSQAFFI